MDSYQISTKCHHCDEELKLVISDERKTHQCPSCKQQVIRSSKIKGYIYVLQNTHSKIVKVGLTEKDVRTRAKQLSSTGVPGKFRVEAYFTSNSPEKDEAKAHKKLYNYLIDKELFNISPEEAIAKICTAFQGRSPLFIREPTAVKVKAIQEKNRATFQKRLGKDK